MRCDQRCEISPGRYPRRLITTSTLQFKRLRADESQFAEPMLNARCDGDCVRRRDGKAMTYTNTIGLFTITFVFNIHWSIDDIRVYIQSLNTCQNTAKHLVIEHARRASNVGRERDTERILKWRNC